MGWFPAEVVAQVTRVAAALVVLVVFACGLGKEKRT
jgi:hypothetical protein